MSPSFPKLKIDVFADGANKADMLKRYREGFVRGFTTNPSLMVKAGVKDYEGFARDLLTEVKDLPISFEVFSDDFEEMEKQALKIATWGNNVNVKIPIQNTRGSPAFALIRKLLDRELKLNLTAIFTQEQLDGLREILKSNDDVIVSIFAGRLADTGLDPMPLMKKAVQDYKKLTGSKILWASSRETLNVYQAQDCGCHIITATDEIIGKLPLFGKSAADMSLETVKTFFSDSQRAGFLL